ncbi:phage minor head protein [Streptomyces bacillaris]|uniref:phage minor head protein n=1 Tax=Streptomyces bacillaris TaxID=68179 RepID=UPI00363D1009
MSARDDQLDQEEADFGLLVAQVLTETADEFAAELEGATEIVAARFSVARIASMWAARIPRLLRRLLGVSETAAVQAADDVDLQLPDGWDDLPGRHDRGEDLPPGIGQYVTTTEHLLRAVGEHLAEAAVRELGAGLDAGEDIEQLRARLTAAFARDGAKLGPGREQRVSRTEAARAWNTATLAAGRDMSGPDRPLVKQWLTRRDTAVRDAHAKANGQLRLLDEDFTVGGVKMSAPLDPTAPAALTVNCRCRLALAHATQASAFEPKDRTRPHVYESKEPSMDPAMTAAADGSHPTGASIALIPTEADAARLAIEGGEDADELHLTLYFLGQGADWSEDQRAELIENVRAQVQEHGLADDLVYGRAFGASHWNAGSDRPCWVWSVGDDRDRPDDAPTLQSAHRAATYALEDRHGPDIPVQHSPWVAHVSAAYSEDPALLGALEERLGPITFDRIRLAFAGDYTDIPIGPQEEPMEPEENATTADGMPTRSWSTPDDTALAYENEETGDGRIFAAGSLYWDRDPAPLQYADEMLMGHEGAELAGAIETMGRDGSRITGKGVIYSGRPAGADAVMLLEEEAPLGVSVDLDDVSVEFVDRTRTDEDAALYASLPAANVIQLPDGAYVIRTATSSAWTASGAALTASWSVTHLVTGPGGRVTASALGRAFPGLLRDKAGTTVTAAAGDPDDPDGGVVVHAENTGDFLMRVTRARVRGATLVAMPAYSRARIVLDPVDEEAAERAAAMSRVAALIASSPSDDHWRVVNYVAASPVAVGARDVAQALGITMQSARGHLVRAAEAGRIVAMGEGLYVGATSLPEGEAAASATASATASAAADEAEPGAELIASAWAAMQDLPPMPADWFKEPTEEELPPGSGGVHYAKGRVYGWVAQRGVPHAGYPGRNLTIEKLAQKGLDFSHFLRARFELDDGSTVKVGAMTMNVGHDGDGAQCSDAVCQFDNSGTVGAIVTVGMSRGGLWFSGAGAPWLSAWDQTVFRACQPSYHLREKRGGGWELRAVLDVPVPGHSSPLVAAVIQRSNLALAASAAAVSAAPGHATDNGPTLSGQGPDTAPGQGADTAADVPGQGADSLSGPAADNGGRREALIAALLDAPETLRALVAHLDERDAANRAEADRLAASLAPARQHVLAGTAQNGAS